MGLTHNCPNAPPALWLSRVHIAAAFSCTLSSNVDIIWMYLGWWESDLTRWCLTPRFSSKYDSYRTTRHSMVLRSTIDAFLASCRLPIWKLIWMYCFTGYQRHPSTVSGAVIWTLSTGSVNLVAGYRAPCFTTKTHGTIFSSGLVSCFAWATSFSKGNAFEGRLKTSWVVVTFRNKGCYVIISRIYLISYQ